MIARWSEARSDPEQRLQFIKEYAQDTSFASVVVYERHARREEDFDETLYHRVSQAGLRRKYETDRFLNWEEWVEEDLRGACRRPLDNPDHPNDPDWALHRVLMRVVDGVRTARLKEQGIGLDTRIAPEHAPALAAAAHVLSDGSRGLRDYVPNFGSENPPAAKAKAKGKAVLSEEQVAAAAQKRAADELLRKHRKLADAQARVLANLCGRLQRAAAL